MALTLRLLLGSRTEDGTTSLSELMQFHRQEQMKKLGAILRTLLKLKKVDNFSLATEQRPTN